MELDLPERIPVFVAIGEATAAGASKPSNSELPADLLIEALTVADARSGGAILPALDRIVVLGPPEACLGLGQHLPPRALLHKEDTQPIMAVLDAAMRIASGECDVVTVVGLNVAFATLEVERDPALVYTLYEHAVDHGALEAGETNSAAPVRLRAAALVLASLAWARDAGISDASLVYFWGGGSAQETADPWRRARFDSCMAQVALLNYMTAVAGGTARFASIGLGGGHPVATNRAMIALGMETDDRRIIRKSQIDLEDVRVAIVGLRDHGVGCAMLYAEEAAFAEHCAITVALEPPPFLVQPVDVQEMVEERRPNRRDVIETYVGPARLETYAPILLGNRELSHHIALVITPDHKRVLCRVRPDDSITLDAVGLPHASDGRDGHVRTDAFGNQVWESGPVRRLVGQSPRFCTVERDGPLTIVTIACLDAGNALGPAVNEELAEIMDGFSADPAQWVAILTAAGDYSFSNGANVTDAIEAASKGAEVMLPVTGYAGLTARWDLTKPVIAAVNGAALGAGFEVALACDVIVAADTARFGLPEPQMGLVAIGGGLSRLPREIGLKRAMDMILTGATVSADEGLALGFVNQVVPRASLMSAARAKAEAILSCGPLSVQASKHGVLRAFGEPDLRRASERQLSGQAMRSLLLSEDVREGVDARAQVRAPRWRGQ